MALIARRRLRETWREAVAARCAPAADQALAEYEALLPARGEAGAAYAVLAARRLLWRVDETGSLRDESGRPDEVPAV